MRVPRVAAATIRGRGLVEEIRYYGVCKTFVVAAAATVIGVARSLVLAGHLLYAIPLASREIA